jgi:hypothetical protein
MAQRALGRVQPPAGLGKAQLFGDRNEVSEVPQFHGAFYSTMMPCGSTSAARRGQGIETWHVCHSDLQTLRIGQRFL